MTIDEMINRLNEIRDLHGVIQVYFDCPECNNSFTPNRVITLALHLTEEKKR
jgi:hypothetical protein